MLDAIMLSLRTADGLQLAAFQRRYGSAALRALLPVLEKHSQAGLMAWTDASEQPLRQEPAAASLRQLLAWSEHEHEQGSMHGLEGQVIRSETDSSRSGQRNTPMASSSSIPGVHAVQLVDPQGFLLSNQVISDLFAAL